MASAPQRTYTRQLGFYVLLQLLHEEANIVSLQLRLVKQAKLQRFQKKTYRNLQGKILRYWDKFTAGQKTSSQLLKACSRVYAPEELKVDSKAEYRYSA